LTAIRIAAVPAFGRLELSGVSVTNGQQIAVADLSNLVFRPQTNFFGFDYFYWQAVTASGIVPGLYRFDVFVQSVEDVPVATADVIYVKPGHSTTLLANGQTSLLWNDFDGDGDAITASLVSGVTNGTLILNANGTFQYTHNGGSSRSDGFTYRITDGKTFTSPATVSIGIFDLVITGVSRDGADIVVTSTGQPGKNYVLQFTTDLGASNWTTIGTGTETSPGIFTFRDPAPSDQNRFYRVGQP